MPELMNAPTIMVVDDVPANLQLLQQMLKAKKYRVVTFPSGQLALSAAARTPPDLILLDINMPGMSGFEVCEQLKADEKLKEIPVIFISALTETTDKVRAFALGGLDYVTKPFQFEEVHARVKTHLRMRSMQLELEKHNFHLEKLVEEQVKEISESQMATIGALARLAESRDDDTGKHINRTQTFCKMLAERLLVDGKYVDEIDQSFIDNIYHAAVLHDIGKVAIPDKILLKPARLTPEEFEIMKTHAALGAETLRTVYLQYPKNAFLSIGILLTLSHHEKWDGSGYPDGLAGEDIPLSARIMAVGDVYDALRSKRPYKEPFSHEKSCSIIMEGTGKHFDPTIIAAFSAIEADFNETFTALSDLGES